MLKRIIAYLPIILLLTLLASCSGDDEGNAVLPEGTPVSVRLSIAAYSGGDTRAWDGTQGEADASELMRNWLVLVVNASNNTLEKVIVSGAVDNLETDYIDEELTVGNKVFYSFANISLDDLQTALGVTLNPGITLAHDVVSTAAYHANGNNWTGASGIPMSNWQQAAVTGEAQEISLYVCRMIAKLEFRLSNLTGNNITVKNIQISDITPDEQEIKLLPQQSVAEGFAGTMQPNIISGNTSAPVTVSALRGDGTDAIMLSSGATAAATVYVNESVVGAQSRYGLFQLTLTLDKDGTEEEVRYALVGNDNNNWTYIARNDYRIIPIAIDDYKLDVVPVDFPPIGVYPASVKEEDGIFTCTFHAGGNFSFIPVVTRYSTGEQLPYDSAAGTGTWNYVDGSWTISNPQAIYQTHPWWNAGDHRFDGAFNNATGEAYHEFKVRVNKGSSAQQTLVYRLWVIRK